LAINAFDAVNKGYNVSLFADAPTRGRKASEKEKLARSISQLGREVSKETGRAISEAKHGVPLSAQHRRALSAAKFGKRLSEKHRQALVGSHEVTEETRRTCRNVWNSHTREFKAWLVRKGAATRWGNPFNEPKPTPLE